MKIIDRYLRRSDTNIAVLAKTLSPHQGTEYLNSKAKRCLDLGVAFPAALLATPAIILLSLLKFIEDGGSPFFIHERVGQHEGDKINLVKIRCMPPNSDKGRDNIAVATGLRPSQDPRNTKLGAFMRSYQLEELPQVFQVLQGKLSVLGIRPSTQHGFDNQKAYWSDERYLSWVKAYHAAPLGVSGLNQAMGSDLKEDEKRYHLDIFYAQHASLGFDFYLLWKTALRLLGVTPRK